MLKVFFVCVFFNLNNNILFAYNVNIQFTFQDNSMTITVISNMYVIHCNYSKNHRIYSLRG